jgi:hypothetical protein
MIDVPHARKVMVVSVVAPHASQTHCIMML